MKIGITYDLRDDYIKEGYSLEETAELDRISTIDAIDNAIKSLGHQTERIGNIKSLIKNLNKGNRWDLVFNISEGLHGKYSRESQVPAILEAYRIPYTFSDPLVLAISLKKDLAKLIVKSYGYRTPDFVVVTDEKELSFINIDFPLFIKPIAEGTSKGITEKSKVNNFKELKENCIELLNKFKQPVLVEKYCSGREFTAGLIGTGDNARYIGAIEVMLNEKAEKHAYTYSNKENCEELVEYKLVTDNVLNEKLKDISESIWRLLDCRDAGRMDLKMDENNDLNFIEVNPLAGLHPEHSDLPIIFNKLNIPYQKLIEYIINSAIERIEVKK